MLTQTPTMTKQQNARVQKLTAKAGRKFSFRSCVGKLSILAGLLILAASPASNLYASDDAVKIRLLADALRAREASDYQTAMTHLVALQALEPDNQRVSRLITRTEKDLSESVSTPSSPVQTASAPADTVGRLLAATASDQDSRIANSRDALAAARVQASEGNFDQAQSLLAEARAGLTRNVRTDSLINEIDHASRLFHIEEAMELIEEGRFNTAQTSLDRFLANPGESRTLRRMANSVERTLRDPRQRNISEFSPTLVADRQIIDDLILRGRAQFYNGDFSGARQTFEEVETRDPDNPEAKVYQLEIARRLNQMGYLDRAKTREQMLNEVSRGWQRPRVFDAAVGIADVDDADSPILDKLRRIRIPRVSFTNTPLPRVLETLSDLSVEFDRDEPDPNRRGVNIVLIDGGTTPPNISISLRNLTLDRVLSFITQQVNFQYDIVDDAIVVRATSDTGERRDLITDFFPIGRATVIRLTGGGGGGAAAAGPRSPFDPAPAPTGGGAGDEEGAIRDFFERAGVNFSNVPGSSLAFDGTQLIITQTARNMERIRTILRRYDRTRQVEIEAKFIEVAQGNLDELGFQWMVDARLRPQFDPTTGLPTLGSDGRPVRSPRSTFDSANRSLSDAFSVDTRASTLRITRPAPPPITDSDGNVTQSFPEPPPIDLPISPPNFGSTDNLASGVTEPLFNTVGIIGSTEVGMMIRALSRQRGTDLMSAPRLTVLSGKTANITIAQELRYPERFTDIQSTVQSGGGSGTTAGTPGVTITAGTPEDFVMRPVGVELEVTPTVEDNDNISLLLSPQVTEFEGFIDYGGPSVAIAGGTTATIPAGFYQPIFSTRSVRTEVTIFDGATVVIGGLTREEVRTVRDKVPVLGDVPLLGRFFRSEGEASEKRNLLIFVTANLISPGGSPIRQEIQNIESNSLFQNPVLITPGGGVNRGRTAP